MSIVLDGKLQAKKQREKLKDSCMYLEAQGIIPSLAIIQGGDRADSNKYITNKINACSEVGVDVTHIKVDYSGSPAKFFQELADVLTHANKEYGAVILQKPVPYITQAMEESLTDIIDATKDVDKLTTASQSHFYALKSNNLLPCTPKGIISLLKAYDIHLEGKVCCVIGRSDVVGRPLALGFLNKNATPIICHSKTPKDKLRQLIELSDIVVSAVGIADFIDESFKDCFDESKVVVDVGINVKDGKLVGDIKECIKQQCGYYTPVPGGVGPMTIAELISEVIQRAY